MALMEDKDNWNPVILVVDETGSAYSILNPNDWAEESKAIIGSCAAQLALLLFSTATLSRAPDNAATICAGRLDVLRHQWRAGPWDLARCRYFVEVPAVHLSIQAFLVTAKNLLDLLAQLLSSERIVHTKLHGFHKKGPVVGGEVLHALARKRNPKRIAAADAVSEHVSRHKLIWIDEAVRARDGLAHPMRGTSQVMWELEVRVQNDEIVCDRTVPPHIGDQTFDRYAHDTLQAVKEFTIEFLARVRTA